VDAAAPRQLPGDPILRSLRNSRPKTRGESLLRGLENLPRRSPESRIATTDESAFEVGRNIAVTPAAVVYENELMAS